MKEPNCPDRPPTAPLVEEKRVLDLQGLHLDGLDEVFELLVADRLVLHGQPYACALRSKAETETIRTRADRDRGEEQQEQDVEDDREGVAFESPAKIRLASQGGEPVRNTQGLGNLLTLWGGDKARKACVLAFIAA
jgi:hypothetical protein